MNNLPTLKVNKFRTEKSVWHFKKKSSDVGFKNTSSFLGRLTQRSLEKKGFAQSKLITNWNEIVGWELSKQAKPVKITFPKSGLGATLTIEICGSFGPEIDLQRESIKEKVNRVYGYTAIAKIIYRSSPFMGYEPKMKKKFFKENNTKDFEISKSKMINGTLKKTLLNLENTKNKELRKVLHQFSSNFYKLLSTESQE